MAITIVNRYNGKCQSCGTKLSAGEGFAYKNGYAWYKVCPSTACMARLGVTPPSAESNQPKTLSENGVISMPYDSKAITMLRSLPGAKWDPNNKNWICSVKTGDLPRVLEIADILQLSVPEALRQRCAEGTQESREALQRTFRKRIDGKELYDFQRTGVQFLALHERALLADDQGIGKTIQTLVALPNDSKVILICPAVVKYNWRNEISLWRPEYKVTILEGRKSFKLPEQGEIVILNYDILPAWLSSDIPDETKVILKDTILVADEAHMVKNYKTARSQKITRLSKACKTVWFLTGTPLMTRPQDLYGVISAGNMNVLGGWDKFVSLFDGYKDKFGWRFGMPSAEVPERMKRVMLRRLKSEVLKDLPPKTYKNIEVNNLGTAFYSKINSLLSKIDPYEKDIDNLISKLEITSLPSFDEFSQIRALLAEAKIPAMMELVESYEESGTPLVVFSAHKAPVLSLGERDGWGAITGETKAEERTEIVQKFQNGDLKGIGLTIQAGGVGITLTRASDVLFVDMDWTPGWNLQAEDRLCIAEGQLVAIKDKGYIPIEKVVIGDEVFTHMSRWRKVINIHSKQNRKLNTIIKYKRFSESLLSTHDHKIFVLKQNETKPKWIKAHEILPGDFLVLPKFKTGNGINCITFPLELRHDPMQINNYGVEHINGRYVRIPDIINLDSEALFAFGYYLANGFSSITSGKGRFVSWAAHKKNRAYLERIANWLKILGVKSTIYNKTDSLGIELRGYSIELATLFEYLFGRTADKKHIPNQWLAELNCKQLNELFQAYLMGDGYFRKSQQSWGTVSVKLAMQLNLITTTFNYAPCLNINNDYESSIADSEWIGTFTINGNPSNVSLNKQDDNFIYNPVTSVTTKFAKSGNKTIRVYDLEVDEDESFLVGNAVVHNCRIGQTSDNVLVMRMNSSHPLDIRIQHLIEYKTKLMQKALDESFKFSPPKARPLAQDIKIIEETAEELAERMKAAESEVERNYALSRLQEIAGREAAKVDGVPEPELTPNRKRLLREALDYMISVCDGAIEKDGMGFNRPDAFIGHWIFATGLREEDELAFRVLERILCRYRRQLKEEFEGIWKPELEV